MLKASAPSVAVIKNDLILNREVIKFSLLGESNEGLYIYRSFSKVAVNSICIARKKAILNLF